MFMQIYADNIQCSRNSLHVHANCSKFPPPQVHFLKPQITKNRHVCMDEYT